MKNASLPRRLGAMLYDGLLVFALLCLGTLPFVALEGGEYVPAGSLAHQLTMFGIIYLFYLGFWTRYGRTLGMQSWRLRIVDAEGRKPDVRAATLRFSVAILSWLPLGLGYWWQLVDREGLSWHDRASGTRLLHVRKAGQGD